jgi:hypothetical protein
MLNDPTKTISLRTENTRQIIIDGTEGGRGRARQVHLVSLKCALYVTRQNYRLLPASRSSSVGRNTIDLCRLAPGRRPMLGSLLIAVTLFASRHPAPSRDRRLGA